MEKKSYLHWKKQKQKNIYQCNKFLTQLGSNLQSSFTYVVCKKQTIGHS